MSATDSKSDALFWREFGIVLGLLFVFFVAMIVLALAVGGAALDRIANAEGDVLARRGEDLGGAEAEQRGSEPSGCRGRCGRRAARSKECPMGG